MLIDNYSTTAAVLQLTILFCVLVYSPGVSKRADVTGSSSLFHQLPSSYSPPHSLVETNHPITAGILLTQYGCWVVLGEVVSTA